MEELKSKVAEVENATKSCKHKLTPKRQVSPSHKMSTSKCYLRKDTVLLLGEKKVNVLYFGLCAVRAERRGPTKSQTSVSLPLQRLEPHTPQLCQLVSQWQKLWIQAHSRQTRLEEHQQRLREVITINVLLCYKHNCIKYCPN